VETHVLHRLWLSFRSLLFRRRLEREMRAEMDAHLARSVDRLMGQGMSRADAERAARREFGNLDVIREEARDARGGRWLDSLVADLRFGLRQFRRQPLSALTIVVVLALGIAFNAALFVVISAIVSGELPGVPPDRSLVRIRGGERNLSRGHTVGREFSYPEYRDYAAETRAFSAVAAWTSADVTLDVGRPEANEEYLISGAASYVTAGYFQVLGVGLAAGAGLPLDGRDDGEPHLAAVISHVLWDRYYDRADDVVGRTLEVNGVPATIVGVAPRRFNGARTGGSQARVWLPLSARPVVQRAPSTAQLGHETPIFGLVARLQPGVQASDTGPTAEAVTARAVHERASRDERSTLTADVVPLLAENYFPPSGLPPDGGAGPIVGKLIPMMIPILILSITGTTASALQAGLAIARRREIAVRLALGASRRRIVRQLVTESVTLAFAAGALGLFVIWILIRVVESALPDLLMRIDWASLTFTGGIALAAGVLFGLSPALHATSLSEGLRPPDSPTRALRSRGSLARIARGTPVHEKASRPGGLSLADVLKDAATAFVPSQSRLQSGLVVAQIALTQPALLLMGGLLLAVVDSLREMPGAVRADQILDARFNTNPRYGALDDVREQALARVRSRIEAVPGVVAVVAQDVGDSHAELSVHSSDREPGVDHGSTEDIRVTVAPPGYFDLMSLPVVLGRDFRAPDASDTGIVIGARLARDLWGDANPIGRRLTGVMSGRHAGTFTVIGVVDDSASALGRRVYVPRVRVTGSFLIRTEGPAQAAIAAVRAAANNEAPDVPLVSVRTLASIERDEQRTLVRAMAAAGGAGVVALLLSAIGLYAVVSFAVGQRVREIGIRTALGADERRILRMFIRQGVSLSLAGVVIGLTLSLAVARLMAAVSVGGQPPGTAAVAGMVALVVTGVALLATWIPARRATRVDPLAALRME
jgi:cell division protein FtsX